MKTYLLLKKIIMYYTYLIDEESLIESVMREISKIAYAAADSNGNSLYDAVYPTSSDIPELVSAMQSAITNILTRFADIASMAEGEINFLLPDMPEGNTDKATETLSRYIIESTVTDWMLRRFPAKAEEYSARAESTMKKAAVLLKTRKTPHR